MVDDRKEQWKMIIKVSLIAVCAFLYSAGGTEGFWGKELRRYLAPLICGGGLFYFSRDWRSLIKVPLLIGASTLGYGATETIIKILRRGLVGISFGLACSSYHIWLSIIRKEWKQWLIIGTSFVFLVLSFVVFGVWNPIDARSEETLLGLLIYTLAIMPVNRKEQ